MEELTLIDFIGQMINHQKTIEAGFKYATRGTTLRDDLKEEYRKEAEKIVEEWKANEMKAEKKEGKLLKMT